MNHLGRPNIHYKRDSLYLEKISTEMELFGLKIRYNSQEFGLSRFVITGLLCLAVGGNSICTLVNLYKGMYCTCTYVHREIMNACLKTITIRIHAFARL